ncbi:hypothetical protein E5222_10575 [Alteraurantiacibacter aquimixticola]|uniref:TetR/AcrR family transcriptional regulator n=2 Tax=Alteraurantiacibacter aquimixticola TaxID=2489173 RepID=A0A4T3F748_9SPHN|nr:hypothetical protein E5222_10575 [Alteraurantiacibacter aquimixticola]
MTALSVRKVGEVAGLNPTLVTYHFGSIGRLLEELCQSNLDILQSGWDGLEEQDNLDDILRTWLEPMFLPAAFTSEGRALLVLDEIGAHGEGALRQIVLDTTLALAHRLVALVKPYCPHLEEVEVIARLRLIAGAVLGPPPRNRGEPLMQDGTSLVDMRFVLPFARAALGC